MIRIVFLLTGVLLFAKNVFIPQNSYVINTQSAQKYYNLKKVELETKTLIDLTKKMLSNAKFKKLSYLEEIGKTKVNTSVLLEALLNFLKGRKAYSNTKFDNNSKEAGILKLIKDIENDTLINLPQKAKDDILNSIQTSAFFQLSRKTEDLLNNINQTSLKDIIKNYILLFNQYVEDLKQINNPLIQDFNPQIQNTLLKDYRIEAKGSVVKTLEIFKKYLNANKKIYE
ncbi:MAG: hypothetical protein GXO62_00440 [Epsilonproteobacteria bacterium]|nr:hypothetical protein [Campylobacterota bacterium]